MKREYFLISLVALLLQFTAVNAQPRSSEQAFFPGEQLCYEVTYSFGFLKMRAAIVTFQTTAIDSSLWQIAVFGNTLSSYNWLFRVNDTLVSQIDAATLLPASFYRHSNEGRYHEQFWHSFDQENHQIITERKVLNSERKRKVISTEESIFDIVSAAYFIRTLAFENTAPGTTFSQSVMISDSIYTLPYIYEGEDNIKDRSGVSYQTLRFSAEMIEGTIFDKSDRVTVWITDDFRHIPIKVRATILIGAVEVYHLPCEEIFE